LAFVDSGYRRQYYSAWQNSAAGISLAMTVRRCIIGAGDRVGVLAAFEARHNLWTFGRQMPVLMVSMVPLIAANPLAQPIGIRTDDLGDLEA
jgi:hypothetical protein